MVLDPLGDLDLERGRLTPVDLERHPQPGHPLEVPVAQVWPLESSPALLRQRVKTSTEQGPHLLRCDLIPNAQPVDAGHAGADPPARGLTLLGVVRRQRGARPLWWGPWPPPAGSGRSYPDPAVIPFRLIVIPPNAFGEVLGGHREPTGYQIVTDNAPGVRLTAFWILAVGTFRQVGELRQCGWVRRGVGRRGRCCAAGGGEFGAWW